MIPDMGEETWRRLLDLLEEGASTMDLKKLLVQTAALLNHRMPDNDQFRHVGMVWPEGMDRCVVFAAGPPAIDLRAAYEGIKDKYTR